MRRVINIFLASSIVEFKEERMIIENFIRNISDTFEEHYNIKIQPLLCENFDDAYTLGRKQEEYNDIIRKSDFCFFILFTKAGEFTREEFQVATEQFRKTQKPKIYTYFKTVEQGQAEQSIYDFMAELEKTFSHYYGTFSHIDTVKLRILLSLKLQEMDFLELKVEGGECLVDGKAVMPLSHVSEFANNKDLANLHRELVQVEEEYYALKPLYDTKSEDPEFYSRYSKIAARRQTLLDEIEELQGLIFNVSLRMVKDDIHGEITPRQKEAYRLFEMGDYEGCMSVLDSSEIDNDFLRERRRIKEQEQTVCRKYIREYKTKIDILSTMTRYKGRFAEIEEIYEKILPIIFEMKIELKTAYNYVTYLYDQNKDSKVLSITEKLLKLYDEDKNIEDIGNVLNFMALSCQNLNQPAKAEEYHRKTIEICEKLAREDPKRYNPDLANSHNNAGKQYYLQNQPAKAEKHFQKAIEIFEKITKEDSDRIRRDLAISYNNAGLFYSKQGQPEKAEIYCKKAIAILEELAKENPDRFNSDLATSYNNAGVFYDDYGNPSKAADYYQKALLIYKEMAKLNPDGFNPFLGGIYNNIAGFYSDQGHTVMATDYYQKAIRIREYLAMDNPDRFIPDLAVSYYCYGIFTNNNAILRKALELAKIQPQNLYCRQIIEDLEG